MEKLFNHLANATAKLAGRPWTFIVCLAVVLIWAFTYFVRGSDGLPLFNITLAPVLALQVAGIATLCGVLAAVAPARRAAQLDPAQAIRL